MPGGANSAPPGIFVYIIVLLCCGHCPIQDFLSLVVDLADQVCVGGILGYMVDQHILEKDKEAQQNAENSDDESGNSGAGEMAVSPGQPCT